MLKGRKRRALPMDLMAVGHADGPVVAPTDEIPWLGPVPDARVIAETDGPAEQAEIRESVRLAFAGNTAAMLHAVYEPAPPPFSTRIAANSPLLRAGPERAARLAGLIPVTPSEDALITLHCDDVAETGTPVDVRAGLDHVTVTISRDLGPETWTALRKLTHELLGPGGTTG